MKNKKINYVFGILLLILVAVPVFAEDNLKVKQSFQSFADINISQELIVPKIVSVTLPQNLLNSQRFGVYNKTEDKFIPHETSRVQSNKVPVQVFNLEQPGRSLSSLVDDNYNTTVDFPITENKKTSEIKLRYSFNGPITSDSFEMSLSQYAVRPTKVSIFIDDGKAENPKVIVSGLIPNSNTINFPVSTSDNWIVQLEYSQPLRFTELYFVNKNIVENKSTLRFLAYSNNQYEIYYDPEVIVAQEVGEKPNLSVTKDMISATVENIRDNYLYKPADSDGDGIPDFIDNCPKHSNEDQIDIDKNNRGDACDDFDRDGIINIEDNCIDIPNRDQADIDRDGIGDACDDEESRPTEKYPWIIWVGLVFAVLIFVGLFIFAIRHNEEKKEEKEDTKERLES